MKLLKNKDTGVVFAYSDLLAARRDMVEVGDKKDAPKAEAKPAKKATPAKKKATKKED